MFGFSFDKLIVRFLTPKSYYKAFSYSHADKKWGDWLHKKLETFRVPKALVGKQTAITIFPID